MEITRRSIEAHIEDRYVPDRIVALSQTMTLDQLEDAAEQDNKKDGKPIFTVRQLNHNIQTYAIVPRININMDAIGLADRLDAARIKAARPVDEASSLPPVEFPPVEPDGESGER